MKQNSYLAPNLLHISNRRIFANLYLVNGVKCGCK